MNLITRELFGGKAEFFNSFDTKGDTGVVFVVRRANDNVEQSFTYNQITDGTYATFVSGTSGFVKEWKSKRKKMTAFSNTYQPYLVENSGNPYLDFSVQGMCLESPNTLKINNDFVATIVIYNETNGNNQRNNLALVGSSLAKFAFQLSGTGLGNVVVDSAAGANMIQTKDFSISNTSGFKMITITYIGTVLNLYVNNVLVANSTPLSPYTNGLVAGNLNRIILGGRGANTNLGKINRYKHFSIRTGSTLSGYDFSSYTASMMTRYGL